MFERLSGEAFIDALGADEGRRTTSNREHAIDWIFLKGLTSLGGKVARVDRASDHYPLVATVARPYGAL